jgi:hypothetical protein
MQKPVLVVRDQQVCSGADVDVMNLHHRKSALYLVEHYINGLYARRLAFVVSTPLR